MFYVFYSLVLLALYNRFNNVNPCLERNNRMDRKYFLCLLSKSKRALNLSFVLFVFCTIIFNQTL